MVVASKNVSATQVRCVAVTSNCKTIVDWSYIRQPPLVPAGPAQSMTFCASDHDGAVSMVPAAGNLREGRPPEWPLFRFNALVPK